MQTLHQAVRDNFAEKAAYVARVMPGMTVTDDESFVAVDCGLPSDTFNLVVARHLSTPDHLLRAGVEPFMAKRFPVALWYWEDEADRQGMAALAAYGLAHTETHIAMYADIAQACVAAPVPADLTISPAVQPDHIRHYGSVIAALFGDSDEGRQVSAYHNLLSEYGMSHLPALRYYIGAYHDRVVATGSLFVGSDTVGIYDIVTQAPYRQQGIGSAMFAYLLNEARRFQHRHAILQASPDGIRIYEKAGFKAAGKVHTFENRVLL
ncbi:MAG TPA: GNAT family N-acetyltransferase [Herpetosiphonaceae bacterium]